MKLCDKKNNDLEYKQFHDYVFKKIVQKHANGVLRFLKIPYKIENIILSEIANCGPNIHRLDFTGEVEKDGEKICIILECQSRLPTDEDVKRFFQYVTSLNSIKNMKVELYILCTENAPYTTKRHVLKDDCEYIMNVISLKHIEAKNIFKTIEEKIKHNKEITEDDLAGLQLIAYTNYEESTLEILKKASKLVAKLDIDINEKEAIFYILDVLSTNMLNESEKNLLMEETKMLNPRYEFQRNEGKQEGIKEGIKEGKQEIAKKLLKEKTLEEVIEITGLTEEQIFAK